MNSYYNEVEGNLHPGDIAKSSDINHIQVHIKDALKNLLNDLHDHESYILGSGDEHKNDFIITPAKTTFGRYIDSLNYFDIQKENQININRYSVKQPISITQTSVYSVIFMAKNSSNIDITLNCKLEDIEGNVLRATNVVLPKQTNEPAEIEAIFDLDFYPTAPGLTHELLKERDGKDIPLNTKEECYDEGYIHDENDERAFSAGVSQVFFVIERVNKNQEDFSENGDEDVGFDPNDSLAVYYSTDIDFAEQKVCAQINSGVDWVAQDYNIFYKEVFSNGPTYYCTGGRAIIDGEPVYCMDTFVNVAGANAYGNVLSYIYLGSDGHLYSRNSKVANTTDLSKFEIDLDDRPPMASLIIAKILTYASTKDNYNKEPLIIQTDDEQDDPYDTRPRSHHERIRRLEKKIKWISDIAVPSRIKYTLTNESWLDTSNDLIKQYKGSGTNASDADNIGKNYTISVDSNGNYVIRLTEAEVTTVKVTLKEKFKNEDGTKKVLQPNDILNASVFSEIKNMVHDEKNGTLKLDVEKKAVASTYGRTKKEAEETKFNPWDDDSKNRIAKGTVKPTERKYTVTAGANGKHDKKSQFPAMTLYLSKNYNLTGLNIPIHKFQNCSGVKFFIWKRQSTNNKKNTVWLEEKLYTSKVFSLDKAKVKGKYQYVDEGFTIKFKKGGLSLKKGQYVIIALPIPKSGKGSCFVETFKPQNSKDFCIRYEGAANASHFLLVDRYQEIWYNSATFTGTEQEYYKSGSVVSGAITWEDAIVPIRYIRPVLKGNLTIPKNCKAKIYGHTGNKWQELTADENNEITNSSGKLFKWKMEFTGDGKGTPELKYDKNDEFAIEFILTRDNINSGKNDFTNEADKNMCLTSVPFDGNDILKKYLGDNNLDTDNDSRFSNFEFARIWADEKENENLLIDISAADKKIEYLLQQGSGETKKTNSYTDSWSYHYCDLTLDDFSKINVDYSNYTEDVEYDENNLRLKLDTEHSYNDDDIAVFDEYIFSKPIPDNSDINDVANRTVTLTNNENIDENQTLLKATFKNPIDLTKYSALKFNFNILKQNKESTISGLGIYISSAEESKTPSTLYLLDEVEYLEDTEVLPPIIDPDISTASYYDGKLIEIVHLDKNGNQAPEQTYYKYTQIYDENKNKYVYRLEQVHDIRSYNIYTMSDFIIPAASSGNNNNNKPQYETISKRIEINPNSTNLQFVKEIGIFSINEETEVGKFSVSSGAPTLFLEKVVGLREDYYTIFDPKEDTGNIIVSDIRSGVASDKYVTTYKNGKHTYSQDTHGDVTPPTVKSTTPETTQITIDTDLIGEIPVQICSFNHDYEGGLSNYKHLGIQLATDIYLPKDSLKINLCSGKNGNNVIASVNLPTLNTVYYPLNNEQTIELSQIFSKIDSDEKIKSVSITTTKHFRNFVENILSTTTTTTETDTTNNESTTTTGTDTTNNESTTTTKIRKSINLYLGKITLYKAETIPVFHKKMRFKFYNTDKNGEITHQSEALSGNSIAIRKVGTIVEYK